MPKPLYLLTGSVAAIAAPAVDYLSGWNFIPNPVYLVPIAVFSWFTKRRTGLVIASLAALSYAVIHGFSERRYSIGGTHLSGMVVQFSACVGVALMADGVRRLVITCRRGSTDDDVARDASGARALMRSINRDGRPRSRSDLDRT